MPSTSKKQHNFMEAIAHSPSFAKKVGVPQSVGQDFSTADKGRKFSQGGNTMATQMDPRMAAMMMAKKRAAMGGAPAMAPGMKKGGGVKKMASGGMTSMGKVKTAAPSRDGIAVKGKTKGTMIKMNKGGMAC
ncbi:hypothetical protein UFOVP654_15 [uncultured Caudovirales phage]|uniref:Uncharacterized protein n=1 Tax=uncultured Caudovirales phage TaxID=2100421 RepID=A0A6J5N646_9CAUD|nr:hypothetical protein UFOVP654_15 [uncultured Caudovirales phage]